MEFNKQFCWCILQWQTPAKLKKTHGLQLRSCAAIMRSAARTHKNSIQKSEVIKSPLFQLASVTYLTITNKRPVLCNSLNDTLVLLDPASFKLDPVLHTLGSHCHFPHRGHSAFHYVKWTNFAVLCQNSYWFYWDVIPRRQSWTVTSIFRKRGAVCDNGSCTSLWISSIFYGRDFFLISDTPNKNITQRD